MAGYRILLSYLYITLFGTLVQMWGISGGNRKKMCKAKEGKFPDSSAVICARYWHSKIWGCNVHEGEDLYRFSSTCCCHHKLQCHLQRSLSMGILWTMIFADDLVICSDNSKWEVFLCNLLFLPHSNNFCIDFPLLFF